MGSELESRLEMALADLNRVRLALTTVANGP